MPYPKLLDWSDVALDILSRLDKTVRQRIYDKTERFAQTGAGVVEPLTGREGSKLRIGDWRVIFTETSDTIHVLYVEHRSRVYKR